jgi:hypothetical protein
MLCTDIAHGIFSSNIMCGYVVLLDGLHLNEMDVPYWSIVFYCYRCRKMLQKRSPRNENEKEYVKLK